MRQLPAFNWRWIYAAKRTGVSLSEYIAKRMSGFKWCTGCKTWHAEEEFPRDRSRPDGFDARCLVAHRRRSFRSVRDPNKTSAHSAVQHAKDTGRIADPNSLPCTDCGHLADDRRHEYDHFEGYAPEHRLTVEPVCTTCHAARESKRRSAARTI